MNRNQATGIMARLAATFPTTSITADVAEVWFNTCLESISYELGERVVQRLAETENDRRLPPPARFNAVRRAMQADDEPPAVGTGPRTRQQEANARRWLAECRKLTEAWRADRPAWADKPRARARR
jgi:hypothetical protein